ncbi:DEAD/DEAH box helicase [sulfur-oxidizing endosymbiont of Gigantopelta aegis]|uniref:DEAD/DEAH box helicase n=1 Tax=sulfur-oxidizing endosymbiont of Gigantopelta aegis TaxID=2794934 RepID=UPI001FE3E7DB|nr:DEAD/DEAH box helicase [sulfur-oxidizing endosymbiont of Gigantopelta aegis]
MSQVAMSQVEMSQHITVLPSGHLQYHHDLAHKQAEQTQAQHIDQAFKQSVAAGLFALVCLKDDKDLSISLKYWRYFTHQYMAARCHESATEQDIQAISPQLDSHSLLKNRPPMQGSEYLSAETYNKLWFDFDQWFCQQVNTSSDTLENFLKKTAPQWHQVGRVCFHLAENKNDIDYPFAFIATYVPKQSKQGKTQHKPLGKALEEYAGSDNKKELIHLLKPINLASQTSPLIADLVSSGDIYSPLAWTSVEAYEFLTSVPDYTESGVIVKLPNWWKKRARPTVSISIGNASQKNFSTDHLLDFNLNLVLGDEQLSPQELEQILSSDEGLIFLKGQWIEVNKDKINQALAHWQSVEQEYGANGISFIEGMRLLAGTTSDLNDKHSNEQEQQWSFVNAGQGLSSILDGLRNPENIKANQPGKALKASLRDYQSIGVNWLHELSQLGLGACLADDMGLGKTIQIISLLLILKKQALKKKDLISYPSLLVLPASLLNNWKDEITKFAPSLNCFFIHGSMISKSELIKMAENSTTMNVFEHYDLIITSYGTLMRQDWLLELNWHLAIIDEAQAIKNSNSRQTKQVKKIKARSRIALTGTPIENRISDLWSLFDFICPGLLGSPAKFKQFIKSLEARKVQQYAPLRNLISPYILRRLKTDKKIISDLPDKTEVQSYCQLTKKQAVIYQKTVKQLAKILNEVKGINRRGQILAFMLKLKQLCNHPSQMNGDDEYLAKDSGKFLRLAEICQEIADKQEKVLIFTQFREIIAPMNLFLNNLFEQPGLVLHGGTSVKKRKEMVDLFQDETGPSHFILSLKAGGTGLNLTAASHVIHFDRWWNPAVENQATDRAFRIGQKNNVLVHKFICKGSIEEKIDALINDKTKLASEILSDNGKEVKLTEMSNEELIQLVSLDVNQTQT